MKFLVLKKKNRISSITSKKNETAVGLPFPAEDQKYGMKFLVLKGEKKKKNLKYYFKKE